MIRTHQKPNRHLMPNPKKRFLFVPDQQSEQRPFIAKLVQTMGLTRHPLRIQIAHHLIHTCKQTPLWLKQIQDSITNEDEYALHRISACLPYDMLMNNEEMTDDTYGCSFTNDAMFLVWIRSMFPLSQGMHKIRCICGLPDDECNDSCPPCRKRLTFSPPCE